MLFSGFLSNYFYIEQLQVLILQDKLNHWQKNSTPKRHDKKTFLRKRTSQFFDFFVDSKIELLLPKLHSFNVCRESFFRYKYSWGFFVREPEEVVINYLEKSVDSWFTEASQG